MEPIREPAEEDTAPSSPPCACGHIKDEHATLAYYDPDPYRNGAAPCTVCGCQDWNPM